MAKDARLHIAPGIDMKVFLPCGNTSLGETAIIPEVNEEHGLGGPKIGQPFPRPIPLFRSHHQGKVGVSSDGNVMKVPEKNASPLYQKIDEGIARQDLVISGSLRRGDGKKDPGLFELLHHPQDSVELAVSPSRIGFFSKPLEADRGRDVSKSHKSTDHLLVDQCTVSIDLEHHIFMLFEEVEEILPQEGFSPRHHDQMDTHLFTFRHESIQNLIRKILLGIDA
jgi:hypothetical protein